RAVALCRPLGHGDARGGAPRPPAHPPGTGRSDRRAPSFGHHRSEAIGRPGACAPAPAVAMAITRKSTCRAADGAAALAPSVLTVRGATVRVCPVSRGVPNPVGSPVSPLVPGKHVIEAFHGS